MVNHRSHWLNRVNRLLSTPWCLINMVVRPCLTRVNVITARGLLWASAQELSYLPDHFCIRLPSSHACSRQQEVFQCYILEEACVCPPIPLCACLSYFPSCSSFSICKTGALSWNVSLSFSVRTGWYSVAEIEILNGGGKRSEFSESVAQKYLKVP